MAKQPWGRDTVIKFLGGEVTMRLVGTKSPEELKQDLDGVIKRSTNMSAVFEEIGLYLMKATERNFEAQGIAPKWPELKESTVKDKQRQGFSSSRILQRTGRLKNSLTKRGAPGMVFRVRPRSMILTSRLKYFRTHQEGDSSRNIPKRRMVQMLPRDRRIVNRMVSDWVFRGKK